jgi:hypothetical protein
MILLPLSPLHSLACGSHVIFFLPPFPIRYSIISPPWPRARRRCGRPLPAPLRLRHGHQPITPFPPSPCPSSVVPTISPILRRHGHRPHLCRGRARTDGKGKEDPNRRIVMSYSLQFPIRSRLIQQHGHQYTTLTCLFYKNIY